MVRRLSNIQQFRWRQEGEQWAETFTVASGIRAVVFTVPNTSEDIEMQVRVGNTNGYGPQSITGELEAADIFSASILTPDKGPTPTATSTDALQIDATWAVGTVPTSAPAITAAQLRWRKAGENWADNRTITLGNVQAHSFDVPDADSDIQMQVAYRNTNGFGAWSDTGTIAAGDIVSGPPLMARTFNTAGAHSFTWPYPQATRARVALQGGAGVAVAAVLVVAVAAAVAPRATVATVVTATAAPETPVVTAAAEAGGGTDGGGGGGARSSGSGSNGSGGSGSGSGSGGGHGGGGADGVGGSGAGRG